MDFERETLDRLLEELDTKGRQQHAADSSEGYWVCQRRHPRYAFRAECTVRYLTGNWDDVAALPGRTRNLSRGGLGLLVKHVFQTGEPIEVELRVPNQAPMFMAGIIQFIRYAGRGYHEIGILLKCAGPQPVFSRNPSVAAQTLDWIKRPAHCGRT